MTLVSHTTNILHQKYIILPLPIVMSPNFDHIFLQTLSLHRIIFKNISEILADIIVSEKLELALVCS